MDLTLPTQEEIAALIAENIHLVPPDPPVDVAKILMASIAFGDELILEFATENVLMGVEQLGMTNHVRKTMSEVISALKTGALSDAIYEARQIPDDKMDDTFITKPRLLIFINKCESFMGLELSTEF